MERYTLSVLVENNPGVLSRVVGLFSRRGFKRSLRHIVHIIFIPVIIRIPILRHIYQMNLQIGRASCRERV